MVDRSGVRFSYPLRLWWSVIACWLWGCILTQGVDGGSWRFLQQLVFCGRVSVGCQNSQQLASEHWLARWQPLQPGLRWRSLMEAGFCCWRSGWRRCSYRRVTRSWLFGKSRRKEDDCLEGLTEILISQSGWWCSRRFGSRLTGARTGGQGGRGSLFTSQWWLKCPLGDVCWWIANGYKLETVSRCEEDSFHVRVGKHWLVMLCR